jgi:hypothetical protein
LRLIAVAVAIWANSLAFGQGVEVGVYNLPGIGVTVYSPTVRQVALSGGRYRFTLINPQIDPRATYFGWSPFADVEYWHTTYSIGFALVPGGPTTTSGGGEWTTANTPQGAWQATQNKSVEVVIPFDQTVNLWIADSYFADNRGGVSVLVEAMSYAHVEFSEISDPVSIVSQTTYPVLGAIVSTMTAPDPYQNYRFTYWTVAGVRMADPTGYGSNPATFTINAPTEAVARYVPTAQDNDADGLPDWWELRFFGDLNPEANDDPDGDTFTNATEYADGTRPNVVETREPGGISRRRGGAFNVDVGVGDPTWPYGGISRRRSTTTTVILDTANLASLVETSDPAGVVAQSRVVRKGDTVNLATAPDPYQGYRFTGWLVNGARHDAPTQYQPIALTVTTDTVAEARYVRQTEDSDSDGIPDWREWFLFNSLQYDQNSDSDGDGFT